MGPEVRFTEHMGTRDRAVFPPLSPPVFSALLQHEYVRGVTDRPRNLSPRAGWMSGVYVWNG